MCDFRHERWRFFHRPSRSSISLLSAEQRAAAVSARAFCASSCCASVCSIEKSPCWSSVSACGGGAGHGGASAAAAFGFLAPPFEMPMLAVEAGACEQWTERAARCEQPKR